MKKLMRPFFIRFCKFAPMIGLASKTILFPYWLVLTIRNYLYDRKVFKSEKFDVPVVSVGNITVGGTGKTPHTEMIVDALRGRYRLAVVSRGYKRKTKGFHLVKITDDYTVCGDEPLQIKRKFPEVIVAVCADRGLAIRKLVKELGVNFIILDDAYQYRSLTPSKNILLVSYKNSIAGDNLLPIGTLRDLPSQRKRADAVIITKSPDFGEYDGIYDEGHAAEEVAREREIWSSELQLRPEQKIYFSTTYHQTAKPVFPECCNVRYLYSKFVVAFTGISNDSLFRAQLASTHKIVGVLSFSDHKNYSRSNIRKIVSMARKQPEATIMTTEKDSQRLRYNKYIPEEIKQRMFYLPVACKIIPQADMKEFIQFVSEN